MTSTAFATSPATVVADARAQLLTLNDTLWAAKRPHELLDIVQRIESLKATLEAIELDVIGEIEATKAAPQDGWASTKDFVTAVSGGLEGSGGTALRMAKSLSMEFPLVKIALTHGTISLKQAEVIVVALSLLPVNLQVRRDAEETLLDLARVHNASELRKLGQHIVAVVDPRGMKGGRRANCHERIVPLTSVGSSRSARTAPVASGSRGAPRSRTQRSSKVLYPRCRPQFRLPARRTSRAPARRRDVRTTGRDPRDHGARFLDAFVEGCRRLMTAEVLPASHGATPRLIVTMTLHDLKEGIGSATVATGEHLSATAVRRLACDCDVIPMVLGTTGEILDVGRSARLVNMALWLALIARDKHCSFPGCRRLPIACDAHHVQHWVDGGRTSLDNVALLCRAHHTMIHNTPWEIRMDRSDGRPEFIPPMRLDPQRRPTRTRRPRE